MNNIETVQKIFVVLNLASSNLTDALKGSSEEEKNIKCTYLTDALKGSSEEEKDIKYTFLKQYLAECCNHDDEKYKAIQGLSSTLQELTNEDTNQSSANNIGALEGEYVGFSTSIIETLQKWHDKIPEDIDENKEEVKKLVQELADEIKRGIIKFGQQLCDLERRGFELKEAIEAAKAEDKDKEDKDLMTFEDDQSTASQKAQEKQTSHPNGSEEQSGKTTMQAPDTEEQESGMATDSSASLDSEASAASPAASPETGGETEEEKQASDPDNSKGHSEEATIHDGTVSETDDDTEKSSEVHTPSDSEAEDDNRDQDAAEVSPVEGSSVESNAMDKPAPSTIRTFIKVEKETMGVVTDSLEAASPSSPASPVKTEERVTDSSSLSEQVRFAASPETGGETRDETEEKMQGQPSDIESEKTTIQKSKEIADALDKNSDTEATKNASRELRGTQSETKEEPEQAHDLNGPEEHSEEAIIHDETKLGEDSGIGNDTEEKSKVQTPLYSKAEDDHRDQGGADAIGEQRAASPEMNDAEATEKASRELRSEKPIQGKNAQIKHRNGVLIGAGILAFGLLDAAVTFTLIALDLIDFTINNRIFQKWDNPTNLYVNASLIFSAATILVGITLFSMAYWSKGISSSSSHGPETNRKPSQISASLGKSISNPSLHDPKTGEGFSQIPDTSLRRSASSPLLYDHETTTAASLMGRGDLVTMTERGNKPEEEKPRSRLSSTGSSQSYYSLRRSNEELSAI